MLGDNKDGRALTLLMKNFQCVGGWISTGLQCIYTYIWPYEHSGPTCAKLDLSRILRNVGHVQLKAVSACVKRVATFLFLCNVIWVSVWNASVREIIM